MELISIIMPAYNSELYIERTIESVLIQTYKKIELIIINDGSTDNTQKICEKMLNVDNRIKLFNKKNEGVAKARNFGLEKAKGKYIMFIDSDDMYAINMVEKMYKMLITQNTDIVRGGYGILNGDFVNENVKEGRYEKKKINEILIDKLLKEEMKSYLWLLLIKRDFIVKFNEELFIYEDANFYLEIFLKANSIYIMKDCLYYYNKQNENSLTKKHIDKNIDNMILSEKFFKKTLEKYEVNNNRNIEKIDTRIITNIINYIYIIQYNQNFKTAIKKYKDITKNSNFIEMKSNYSIDFVTCKERFLNFLILNKYYYGFYILCLLKNWKNKRG